MKHQQLLIFSTWIYYIMIAQTIATQVAQAWRIGRLLFALLVYSEIIDSGRFYCNFRVHYF
jgi:hypothetical protein